MTHKDPSPTEAAQPLLVDIAFRRLFDEPRLLASLLNGLLELPGKQRIASLTIAATKAGLSQLARVLAPEAAVLGVAMTLATLGPVATAMLAAMPTRCVFRPAA